MLHEFPYDAFAPLEIADERISGVYTLSESTSAASDECTVRAALDSPIGCARLGDQVKPGMKVAIAVDDNTRSTRTELMLPIVLEEVVSAGVSASDVTILVALGTHRPMTREQMRDKYTDGVVRDYRIVNPDCDDSSAYADVGESANGAQVRVHREILKADFVVGVGQTIPHMIAGFGGGGKIVNPGCSDETGIGEMHWMCRGVPDGQLFAVRENAVRQVIDDVALRAGLRFILNEVPGSSGIAGAFAGHPVEAHRKACRFARSICEVKIREKADIAVADAYPADMDFWQALKGLNAAYGAVRDGGTVVLVTTCPEGTSSRHDELTALGYSLSIDQISSMVDAGTLDKAVAANLFLGRQLLNRADAILVTTGISEKDTLAMGLEWAADPKEALTSAISRHGDSAVINVLYKASKMICTVN